VYKINFKKYITAYNLCLLIFVVFLLFVSTKTISDGYLEHETPGTFFAARDALYSSQLMTDVLDANGYERASYVSGGEPSYFYRPPLLATTGALISDLTKINEYDVGFFLMLIAALFMILANYLIIAKYSKKLALFSLPLTLAFFSSPFSWALTWGRWGTTLNVLILLVTFLFYCHRKFESPLILGILLGAGFMTHTKESIYFLIIGIPIILIYEYSKKYLNIKNLLKLFWAYCIAFILFLGFLSFSVYYILRGSGNGFTSDFARFAARSDIASFSSLGIFGYFILIGVVIGVWLLWKKKSQLRDTLILGLIFLIITNVGLFWILFQKGITQNRHFWPITLCVFSGLFFHSFFNSIPKKIRRDGAILSSVVFCLILVLVLLSFNFKPISKNMIVNDDTWNGLMWMEKNTSPNATFLSLFGDNLGMDTIHWPSKRNVRIVSPKDYSGAVKSRIFRFNFKLHGVEEYIVRKGLFDFESHTGNEGFENMSLCEFDYLYYNKQTRFRDDLVLYAAVLGTKLIENKSFTIAYDNDLVVILNNPNPEKECLEPFSLTKNENS
jgi:hypothetical protein